MTITDRLIELFVYLMISFTVVSIPLGVINFVTIISTYLTVKGMFVPIPVLMAISVIVGGLFIVFGYFMRVYNIQGRITSMVNRFLNPEISEMWRITAMNQKRLEAICRKLDIRDEDLK